MEEGTIFWRGSRVEFLGIMAQRCLNRHGWFLVVEEYGGGSWRGLILVSEGRLGKGWRACASELQVVMNYSQSIRGGGVMGDNGYRSSWGEGNSNSEAGAKIYVRDRR